MGIVSVSSNFDVVCLIISVALLLTGCGVMDCYGGMNAYDKFDIERERFAKTIVKKYEVSFLVLGEEDMLDEEGVIHAYNMMSQKCLEKEAVGKLARQIVTDTWEYFQNHPTYLEAERLSAHEVDYMADDFWPPRFEHFGLKLSFWDSNMDRMKPPCVAQVRVANGKVFYYFANPDDSLGEPVIEKF